MKSQKGQIILILVLVMTVALAIGLSVIQRSLSDVSTSTKVEQSSRAFSAAEAGIEKAIQSGIGSNVPSPDLGNNSLIKGVGVNNIPIPGNALEDSLYKEEMTQVWLADPTANLPTCSAPNVCYTQPSFDVYFGKVNTTDKPALEVTVVSWDGAKYVSTKKFFDSDATRAAANNFTYANCTNDFTIFTNANSNPDTSRFYCKTSVSGYPYVSPAKAILVRLRLLYSSLRQPVAVAPITGSSLPVQAKIYKSTGISGQTQRIIQVIRYNYVVPEYFDFAIFSSGDINK